MSTLHVENLKGLSSGSNDNTLIVPSGQTLDASAGVITPSSGAVIQVVEQEGNGSASKGYGTATKYRASGFVNVDD